MEDQYILEMKNISKAFPGVQALDNVELSVKKGKVHALMGENGAGKSTLMKILIGMYLPDSGSITFKGEQKNFNHTKEALDSGISMIHQELSPIPHMTIAENIFLGREPTIGKTGWVNGKQMNKDTAELLKSLEINLDPKTKMHEISIADTQLVEIAKAISYNSELIIMDEPTSAISDKEVDNLFEMIRSLTKQGVSIIYISHKMDEIFQISDYVTVFRDGEYVDTQSTQDITIEDVIKMMVGREITQICPISTAEIKDVILEVKNLSQKGCFSNINFKLRKGEILGISGLMGAGRTEVIESIFGLREVSEGEIFINGEKVNIRTPEDAIRHGMALLTEDRKLSGLFLPHSVTDNMSIASIGNYLKGIFVQRKKVNKACRKEKERLEIKTPNLEQTVNNLSGGNQQKVLLAKWLLTDPDILILDEPTRGVDVGAKGEIYNLICELACQGKAIIMISSELPEILGMSDRILVMHEGQIKGELLREQANQEEIMKYATGMVG